MSVSVLKNNSPKVTTLVVIILAITVSVDSLRFFEINSATLISLITVGLGIFTVFKAITLAGAKWKTSNRNWWILGYVLLNLGLLVFHPIDKSALQTILVFLTFVSIVYVCSKSLTIEDVQNITRQLQRILVFISLIYIGLCLMYGPENSILFGPRSLGILVAVLTPVIFSRAISNTSFYTILLISFTAVLLSQSRTSIAIMLLYFLISLGRFKKRARLFSLIVLIPIFLFFVFTIFTEFGFLRSRTLGGDAGIRIGDYVVSTQGRVAFWTLILNQQEGYTLFGQGPGSVREVLSGKFSNLNEPHNDFIRIYYESGLIGISLFICGLTSYLRNLTKNIVRLPSQLRIQNIFFSASLSLLAFITQALTDNPIVYIFVMAPLGLITGSALSQANSQWRQEESKDLKRESRRK